MIFIHDVWNILLENLRETSWMEYIAASAGLISVWFARNRSILVYPSGIISVLLYVFLMYRIGFYANSLVNFIYFLMSIYGWYYWSRSKDKGSNFIPERIRKKDIFLYLAILIIPFIILYPVLKRTTENPYFFWDALTTSIFILAMWMLATKKTWNWIAWIAGDLICVPLFMAQGMVLTGFQYFVFLFIAISGYFSWRKLGVKEAC